jgi:uncharacterized protein with GYD domain
MPTFISYLNWTEQGIRNVKDAPDRAEAARAAIKNLGGEIKDVYLTTGQYDLLVISDLPDADSMAKFTLTLAQQGNVRSTTVRGFTEEEFRGIIDDLP